MKYEDIAKIQKFQICICQNCGKRITNGIDRIHFISNPEFFDLDNPLKESSFEEVYPYCQECHNLIFGEDIE